MKKLVSVLMLAAMLCGAAFTFGGCNASRENVLKICTWEAYTDKKYVKKHFDYTNPETGKKVVVQLSTFNSNEELYENVAVNKADYDLICPSDYTVEKLLNEDMLIKLDKQVISGYDDELEENILKKVEGISEKYNAKDYAFPYAWGTFGIMYNTEIKGKKVTNPADMASWNALWNLKEDGKTDAGYKDKIYMKDSARDAFAAANIYLNADKLSGASDGFKNYKADEYKTLLNEMFATPDQKTVDAVKAKLIDQKKVFFDYEDENGKEALAKNKVEAYLGLFWSCDAGYAMQKNKTKTLRYSIPREGANFYVDCFVIPKYAKNAAAAQSFIKFLLDKDTAYANTMASGASGTVKAANAMIKAELESDAGFMKGASADFKRNYIDVVMFPDADTLDRCAIMRDYGGDMVATVTNMFITVRTA